MPTIHDRASGLVLRLREIVIELDSSPLLHFSSHFRLNEAEFLKPDHRVSRKPLLMWKGRKELR